MSWQLVAAVIGGVGSIKSGQSQKKAAEANAQQMERDMELARVEAAQNALARTQDYAQSVSSNEAFFAFSGRDVSDRSVRAFMQRQEEIYSTDISRLASGTEMRAKSASARAGAERKRGRSALTAGYLGAGQSFGEGIYKYNVTARAGNRPTLFGKNK